MSNEKGKISHGADGSFALKTAIKVAALPVEAMLAYDGLTKMLNVVMPQSCYIDPNCYNTLGVVALGLTMLIVGAPPLVMRAINNGKGK